MGFLSVNRLVAMQDMLKETSCTTLAQCVHDRCCIVSDRNSGLHFVTYCHMQRLGGIVYMYNNFSFDDHDVGCN
jgi:hypothetical protein